MSRLPDPIRETIALPGGEMALLRWPNAGAPRLVFAHANGFCAMAAAPMLARLANRFDIVAPDLRGHGRTALPADPATHRSWKVYADDLLLLNAALDRPAAFLAGHSMGATSSLLAASRMDDPPPLALVEPVILPPPLYLAARTPAWGLFKRSMSIAKAARKRSRAWPDRAAVRTRYKAKPNFARWDDAALDGYLEDGLAETADGVALSCSPEWEAANYEAQGHDPFAAARRIGERARAFRAEHGSTLIGAGALRRRGVRIDAQAGIGHLAVMEDPARVADWIASVWDETR
ncbi:MAG: alpha/beta hydrolase [Oceanicaulis sp.]